MNNRKLILVELNELNFELIKEYTQKYELPNFKKLLENITTTSSENEYKLLEPWIQWLTIKTGLSALEHNIFRLGDINNSFESIYEKIENMGFSVGAVSPMNSPNNCKNAKYFIPDPWSLSKSDNSSLSKKIFKMLKQTVNDNAKNGISFESYITILKLIIFYSNLKNLHFYIKYFFTSHKAKWKKALFLDLLLHDVHLKLLKNKNQTFQVFFLMVGHIFNIIIYLIL